MQAYNPFSQENMRYKEDQTWKEKSSSEKRRWAMANKSNFFPSHFNLLPSPAPNYF